MTEEIKNMPEEKLLRELTADIREIKTMLKNGQKKMDDHEKRIRFLERVAFIAIGIIGLAQYFLK